MFTMGGFTKCEDLLYRRICGGQCIIDQFYESNKLSTDIYLSPPDVSKRRGFRAGAWVGVEGVEGLASRFRG